MSAQSWISPQYAFGECVRVCARKCFQNRLGQSRQGAEAFHPIRVALNTPKNSYLHTHTQASFILVSNFSICVDSHPLTIKVYVYVFERWEGFGLGRLGAWRREVSTQLRGETASDMAAVPAGPTGQQTNASAGRNKRSRGSQTDRQNADRGEMCWLSFSLQSCAMEGG